MEKPQGAAISPSLRTQTWVPFASGDTATPLLFLVQSEKGTTDSVKGLDFDTGSPGVIEVNPEIEFEEVSHVSTPPDRRRNSFRPVNGRSVGRNDPDSREILRIPDRG
jgi:hypothetical protein